MNSASRLFVFHLFSWLFVFTAQGNHVRILVSKVPMASDSIQRPKKIEKPGPIKIDEEKSRVVVNSRFIAIDNKCAWPNLTVLPDGTFLASIFNQPSHGRMQGDIECWTSADGRFWEKRGAATMHEKSTNRMNVAAGLAGNGDLIVIAAGWSLKPVENKKDELQLVSILRPWVSHSSDGGHNWSVEKEKFPLAEPGMTQFIPFGDITAGLDKSLRVLAYAQSDDKKINKVSMLRSINDGLSWEVMSVISDGYNETEFTGGHNETAFIHLGGGKWLAAARRWKAGASLDLFNSDDDGHTWNLNSALTKNNQHPAHFLRLNNGNILLTYGNRTSGEYGVAIKISKNEGKTWSEEFLVIDDLSNGDSGYPSSVQRFDGKIMTAYYTSGVNTHKRYHMGTVIWELPSLSK